MSYEPKVVLPHLAVHVLPSKPLNAERQSSSLTSWGLHCIPSCLFTHVCSGRAWLLNLRCMDWYKPVVQETCYAAFVVSIPCVDAAIAAPSSMRVCFLVCQHEQHRCQQLKAQIMCTSDVGYLQVCRVCKAPASIHLWMEASSFRHTLAWGV